MKKLVLLIAILGNTITAKAQEKIQTEIGLKSDFIYKNGNIGIGTSDPSEKLHVNGNLLVKANDLYELLFYPNLGVDLRTGLRSSQIQAFDRGTSSYINSLQFRANGFSFNKGINGTSIMYLGEDGKVGIGTVNSEAKLHVDYGPGSSTSIGLKINGGGSIHENITLSLQDTGTAANNINILEFKNGGVRNGIIKSVNPTGGSLTGGNLILETTSDSSESLNSNQLVLKNNGNIGIGTNNPAAKLQVHINGNERALRIKNDFSNSQFNFWTTEVNSNKQLRIDEDTSGKNIVTFYQNGNMGIGTTVPDMKLTVNGNIHAEEVKIDLNIPVPDYVFKKNYKLRSIADVEKFIIKNSHLPEIPSAKEFKENGVLLAKMDMNLLKKIEEITLYTIQQQKEIEELKTLVSKLLEAKD